MVGKALCFFALFHVFVGFMGCTRATESALHDGQASIPVGSTESVAVRVGVDERSIKYLASPAFWWNGGAPDIARCGAAPSSNCSGWMDQNKARACKDEFDRIHEQNARDGFFLVKVNTSQWCRQRCKTRIPDCSGWSCVGGYLSYAGKKLLEVSQACYEGCHVAVREGAAFPLECRNVRASKERNSLERTIAEKREALRHDPSYQARVEAMSNLEGQLARAEVEVQRLKKIEADFDSYVKHTFTPRMKARINSLRAADERLRKALISYVEDVRTVQDAVLSVRNILSNSDQFDQARSSLDAARPRACQPSRIIEVLREDVESERKSITELTNDLLNAARKLDRPQIVNSVLVQIKDFDEQVKITEVPADIVSNEVAKKACANFRNAEFSLLLRQAVVASANSSDSLKPILEQVAGALQEKDAMRAKTDLKLALIESARQMASRVENGRTAFRYTATQGFAAEATRVLFSVLLPAVNMSPSFSLQEKENLKGELISAIKPSVRRWNDLLASEGPEAIIKTRVQSINTRLMFISKKSLRPEASGELVNGWKTLQDDFGDMIKGDVVTIPEGSSSSQLTSFDVSLDQMERRINALIELGRG